MARLHVSIPGAPQSCHGPGASWALGAAWTLLEFCSGPLVRVRWFSRCPYLGLQLFLPCPPGQLGSLILFRTLASWPGGSRG